MSGSEATAGDTKGGAVWQGYRNAEGGMRKVESGDLYSLASGRPAGVEKRPMNTRILRGACLVTVGTILASASIGTTRAQLPYVPHLPFSRSNAAERIVTAAVVTMVVYAIARHQASEEQRRIAEERARRSYARMSAQRRANMKAKKVRYIAVDTQRGAKSSPKAKKTVMIYDTQTQKVATNVAYDVEKTPEVGGTAKIDSYSAEYVGSGL